MGVVIMVPETISKKLRPMCMCVCMWGGGGGGTICTLYYTYSRCHVTKPSPLPLIYNAEG